MDNIKEAFEKWICDNQILDAEAESIKYIFKAGFKAANLLPTEGVCPECGGSGEMSGNDLNYYPPKYGEWECENCKGGKIPLYYTPEDYLRITGEDFPDGALCWVHNDYGYQYASTYRNCNNKDRIYYIVQTAQPAPSQDYKPEV